MAGNLREQNMEVKEPGNQFVKLIPRFAFTALLAVVLLAVSASPVFADTIFDTAKNTGIRMGGMGVVFLAEVISGRKHLTGNHRIFSAAW